MSAHKLIAVSRTAERTAGGGGGDNSTQQFRETRPPSSQRRAKRGPGWDGEGGGGGGSSPQKLQVKGTVDTKEGGNHTLAPQTTATKVGGDALSALVWLWPKTLTPSLP